MNDGMIRALLNTGLLSPNGQAAPQIKLLELPAALQKQSVISGEVVSNKDGQVTLKTPQGNVVFAADVNLTIGQKITLKLQVVMQNAQQNLLVELTSITGQPIKPVPIQQGNAGTTPQPVSVLQAPGVQIPQTTAQLPPAPISQVPTKTPDLVEILPFLPEENLTQFPLLQAKVVEFPKVISDEALTVFLKEILHLPMNKPLPPTIQEGLEKIRRILPLLTRLISPTEMPSSVTQSEVPDHAVLSSLMQLLKSVPQADIKNQPTLSSWPIQNLSLLQTIMPGEGLTKETLTHLINQIKAILPQEIPEGGEDQQKAIVPNPITPSASLVLGQKFVPSLPQGMTPTLLLNFLPDLQQALVLVTAMQKAVHEGPLLPGTVLVTATPSQPTVLSVPFSTLMNASPAVPILPLHPSIGDAWPVLQEVWSDILAQQAAFPEALASLKQTIPTPIPQQMPPAVLLFMAALRMGSPESWLGGNVLEKLQHAEKVALIGQLARDMQTIRTAMAEGGPADAWRPLPMPLQVNNEIVRMQWFYRHQYEDLPSNYTPEDEEENKKRRKTRFIVDVPKTRLGDIQIDGLMHDQNLDVILRTESTVATHMENAIRSRFTHALETSGIFGGISFQAGRHEYVQV